MYTRPEEGSVPAADRGCNGFMIDGVCRFLLNMNGKSCPEIKNHATTPTLRCSLRNTLVIVQSAISVPLKLSISLFYNGEIQQAHNTITDEILASLYFLADLSLKSSSKRIGSLNV